MRLSENFEKSEFVCPCCGDAGIQNIFIQKLQRARDNVDTGFAINSGYRCLSHNESVGGVDGSAHTLGLAADIHCNQSQFRYLLVGSLLRAGFSRIGIYKYFVHVDCDPSKPLGVIWYGSCC